MNVKEFIINNTQDLVTCFSLIQNNPYQNYVEFREEVSKIIAKETHLLSDFQPIMQLFLDPKKDERKVALIKGCAIDHNIPIYDSKDPVHSKHITKKTFIGEVFLEVFSQICELPILSYTTRNDGDFFQDVYAHERYHGTQTQKTDSELYFHNDRTAHKIRADLLCLLSMRADPANIVNTKYIHGEDLLNLIDPELQDILRKNYFVTPFDLISQDSNGLQSSSGNHQILMGKSLFRYYNTRTTVAKTAPEIAYRALLSLKDAITIAPKTSVMIQAGEMFVFPNLEGLHSRDPAYITNKETMHQRYLLKTYNFWSNTRKNEYADLFVQGVSGLIDDAIVDA